MLSRKLSNEILTAAEEKSMDDFLKYLQDLECKGKIELRLEGWDYADSFALHLLGQMTKAVSDGEWWGYELKALKALDEIPCREYEAVKIDAYGFPVEIEDNEELLDLLGISDKIADSVRRQLVC